MGCFYSSQRDSLENDVLRRRLDAALEKSIDVNRRFECKICLDSIVSVVFLPCGHCMTCKSCALSFSTCPMCRMNIDEKTYITFP